MVSRQRGSTLQGYFLRQERHLESEGQAQVRKDVMSWDSGRFVPWDLESCKMFQEEMDSIKPML